MAGGVAYNSVANGRLLRETPFEELYIQPAAGDSGGALGAALYAYHVAAREAARIRDGPRLLGPGYADGEIKTALDARGVSYELIDDEDEAADRGRAARSPAGKVIGWFQGRFEWGPRALGNRSILADPRREEMKDVVNTKIKFREPFRPFAPSILSDRADEYFDLRHDATPAPGAGEVHARGDAGRRRQAGRDPGRQPPGHRPPADASSAETNPRYHNLI